MNIRVVFDKGFSNVLFRDILFIFVFFLISLLHITTPLLPSSVSIQILFLSCSLHLCLTFLCKSHPTGVRSAKIFDPYGTQTFNNSSFTLNKRQPPSLTSTPLINKPIPSSTFTVRPMRLRATTRPVVA
jgi:hypothetical protein